MKNIICFFALFALASCADNAPMGKIETALMEYANKNFDDPDQIKEIVSINVVDTINMHSFIDAMCELIKVCDRKDSICEDMHNRITRAMTPIRSFASNSRVMTNYSKYTNAVNKRKNHYIWSINNNDGYTFEDNIKHLKNNTLNSDTILIISEIKFRINESNGMRLKSLYAMHDTLRSNIEIYDSEMSAREHADKSFNIKQLMENAKDIMELIELYEDEYLQTTILRSIVQIETGIRIE